MCACCKELWQRLVRVTAVATTGVIRLDCCPAQRASNATETEMELQQQQNNDFAMHLQLQQAQALVAAAAVADATENRT